MLNAQVMLGHWGKNICGNDTNVTATITGNHAEPIKILSHKTFRVYGNVCVNCGNKNSTKTLFKSYSIEIDFCAQLTVLWLTFQRINRVLIGILLF